MLRLSTQAAGGTGLRAPLTPSKLGKGAFYTPKKPTQSVVVTAAYVTPNSQDTDGISIIIPLMAHQLYTTESSYFSDTSCVKFSLSACGSHVSTPSFQQQQLVDDSDIKRLWGFYPTRAGVFDAEIHAHMPDEAQRLYAIDEDGA